jgi:predicted CoA-binding protein
MTENDERIPALLASSRIIAIVGLSAKPDRPSHAVASYLQAHGYRIVPVNPTYAGTHILGERCHATLTLANAMLSEEGVPIDVVDCFRQADQLGPVVDEAIAIGARAVWMQLGVVNQAAADKARRAGLAVVMDRCMEIEHMKFAS